MFDLDEVDGTKLLVAGGVLFIVGAGAWTFIGAFLVWVFWQVALYYVTLLVVAVVLYALLFAIVDGGEPEPTTALDSIDETATE